jgi:hypothetical protein
MSPPLLPHQPDSDKQIETHSFKEVSDSMHSVIVSSHDELSSHVLKLGNIYVGVIQQKNVEITSLKNENLEQNKENIKQKTKHADDIQEKNTEITRLQNEMSKQNKEINEYKIKQNKIANFFTSMTKPDEEIDTQVGDKTASTDEENKSSEEYVVGSSNDSDSISSEADKEDVTELVLKESEEKLNDSDSISTETDEGDVNELVLKENEELEKVSEKYKTMFAVRGLNIDDFRVCKVGGGGLCGANCIAMHLTQSANGEGVRREINEHKVKNWDIYKDSYPENATEKIGSNEKEFKNNAHVLHFLTNEPEEAVKMWVDQRDLQAASNMYNIRINVLTTGAPDPKPECHLCKPPFKGESDDSLIKHNETTHNKQVEKAYFEGRKVNARWTIIDPQQRLDDQPENPPIFLIHQDEIHFNLLLHKDHPIRQTVQTNLKVKVSDEKQTKKKRKLNSTQNGQYLEFAIEGGDKEGEIKDYIFKDSYSATNETVGDDEHNAKKSKRGRRGGEKKKDPEKIACKHCQVVSRGLQLSREHIANKHPKDPADLNCKTCGVRQYSVSIAEQCRKCKSIVNKNKIKTRAAEYDENDDVTE